MADKYVVTGTTNRSRSGTESVVFEKDKDGNPTKFISKTHPEELTKAQQETLDSLGVTYEKISATDAAELEETVADAAVASDTAGISPALGDKAKSSGTGDSSGSGK